MERSQITHPPQGAARLRLYIARSTPNSIRAQHNLSVVLNRLEGGFAQPELEVIDVFSQPKRAILDGVVVTPTLIGLASGKRIVLMGDLADQDSVLRTLHDLLAVQPEDRIEQSADSHVEGR